MTKKATHVSTFHFHFVIGKKIKKEQSVAAEEGKVFVNWKISSLKKKDPQHLHSP